MESQSVKNHYMDVSENNGKTPKMDGENNGKPYFLMDDLGGKPTIFGNNQYEQIQANGKIS